MDGVRSRERAQGRRGATGCRPPSPVAAETVVLLDDEEEEVTTLEQEAM
jgi:hypothetical protein